MLHPANTTNDMDFVDYMEVENAYNDMKAIATMTGHDDSPEDLHDYIETIIIRNF